MAGSVDDGIEYPKERFAKGKIEVKEMTDDATYDDVEGMTEATFKNDS